MVTKEDVMKALKKVIDPELGIDIVELGLVYGVKVSKDGLVEVDMTLTSPGCPLATEIMAAAEAKLMKIPGIKKATVEFSFDPPWTPERMSADARMLLGI
jgi:metal-sulfur cluster biosynthetic enzyme